MGCTHATFSCKIHNPVGTKLLTPLRYDLSHLNEHKFRYKFADFVIPLRFGSVKSETTFHFLLHCHNLLYIRSKFYGKIKLLDETLLHLN